MRSASAPVSSRMLMLLPIILIVQTCLRLLKEPSTSQQSSRYTRAPPLFCFALSPPTLIPPQLQQQLSSKVHLGDGPAAPASSAGARTGASLASVPGIVFNPSRSGRFFSILSLIPGTIAADCGMMHAGDVIFKVDGVEQDEVELDTLLQALEGAEGSEAHSCSPAAAAADADAGHAGDGKANQRRGNAISHHTVRDSYFLLLHPLLLLLLNVIRCCRARGP